MHKNGDTETVYPRTYRSEGNVKVFFSGPGVVMSAFAIATLYRLFAGSHDSGSALPVSFFIGFAFWSLYIVNHGRIDG